MAEVQLKSGRRKAPAALVGGFPFDLVVEIQPLVWRRRLLPSGFFPNSVSG